MSEEGFLKAMEREMYERGYRAALALAVREMDRLEVQTNRMRTALENCLLALSNQLPSDVAARIARAALEEQK